MTGSNPSRTRAKLRGCRAWTQGIHKGWTRRIDQITAQITHIIFTDLHNLYIVTVMLFRIWTMSHVSAVVMYRVWFMSSCVCLNTKEQLTRKSRTLLAHTVYLVRDKGTKANQWLIALWLGVRLGLDMLVSCKWSSTVVSYKVTLKPARATLEICRDVHWLEFTASSHSSWGTKQAN